jgi:hypothetical protein
MLQVVARVHFKLSLAGADTSQGNPPWSVYTDHGLDYGATI